MNWVTSLSVVLLQNNLSNEIMPFDVKYLMKIAILINMVIFRNNGGRGTPRMLEAKV